MQIDKAPCPCFVLDAALLKQNIERLRYVQHASGARVLLALKGFALPVAFAWMRDVLSGTTASSLNEARLGYEFFGREVHACAPVYLDSEIGPLLDRVSHITFNSLSQWERFKKHVQGRAVSVALRVNPECSEVSTALYNPGIPGSRLGVSADELKQGLPEGVDGLHFHVLCESGADALARVLEALEQRFAPLLHQVRWLNMGGGHLITDSGYDVELLVKLIKRMREKYDLDIILEPGAAVAWRTGVLVASVEDILERHGVRTLMLNVSFAAHMPDCLEMPYKPRVQGARDPQDGETGWRLGGMTCLAGDFVGDYVFEQEPRVGDRIVFEDMMHYTLVKTTMFNGVSHPSIAVHHEDGRFELIRAFTYDDYRQRMG